MVYSESDLVRLAEEYEDSFDDVPEPFVNGRFGAFELVGHGKQTGAGCQRFFARWGCLRVDLHNIVRLDNGVSYKGKVFVHKVHYSCNNPRCPACYRSWASRESKKIEQRIAEGRKVFGIGAEHIIVGVPECDFGLSFEALRAKAVKVLRVRGVVGGCLIFHGFRYRSSDFVHAGVYFPKGWFWGPHFHCIGFIQGGYGRCRSCHEYNVHGSLACLGCKGFEGVTRRCYEKDKYIAKVKGLRETISGTASYELSHASVKVDVLRFHCVSWFGNCSYRRLHVVYEVVRAVCPLCRHDLVRLLYFGGKGVILDKGVDGYVQDSWEDMNEGMGDCYAEGVGHPLG